MLKKYLIFFLKNLCFFVFIIAVPIAGFFSSTNSLNPLLFYLVIIAPLLFLLPIIWQFYPPHWTKILRVGLHLVLSFLIAALLQTLTNLQDSAQGPKRYAYHFGFSLGPYRILTQNDFVQTILKGVVSVFPYPTQYLFFIVEDGSRVFKIKHDFDKKGFEKEICNKKDRFECFKSIFKMTNSKAAFNNTGCILMTAVGATIIFSDKKKDDVKSIIESTLRVIDLSLMINNSIRNESQIENILPDFPITQFHLIPTKDKKKLNSLELAKRVGLKDFLIGFDLSEFSLSTNKNIAEAYLLKRIENEIIDKFNMSINQKIKNLKENLLGKLTSKNVTSKLSKDEISKFKERIHDLVP